MKVVIIGGVAGGASAAARIRRLDESAEIILFEKGEHISFANCGLPYYVGEVIKEKEKLLVQTPENMKKRFNIDVRVHSEVIKIIPEDKKVEVKNLISNEVYQESYDKLVLSPGAEPFRPNIPGINSNRVFTLRNIPDTYRIKDYVDNNKPQHAIVVGAGFIGLEMAENLKERGVKVSIVELADHVIGPLDYDMASMVHNYIKEKNMGLYLKDGVKALSDKEDYIDVELNSGEIIKADMVIMGIGVRPETSLAKEAGLKIGNTGGIFVDTHMKTSVEDIYAVGDAVEVSDFINRGKALIPLAGPANKQGRIAANNICGIEEEYQGTLGTSILKFFDMAVAMTGNSEAILRKNGIEYEKSFTHSSSHATYYPGAIPLSIKLLFTKNDGKILGAQIIGFTGVDKRIDVIATAIKAGMTVEDLTKLELSYAPPFSSAKDPVNMAGYVATNILKNDMKVFHWNDLKDIIADKNSTLLDVRTPMEVELGTINGAVNIEVDALRNRISELDRNKNIYIFCQVGLRGYIAYRLLKQNGFENVYNLSGGYKTYSQVIKEIKNDDDENNEKKKSENELVKEIDIDTQISNDIEIDVDACGLQCPGPIMKVYEAQKNLSEGQIMRVKATDPAFCEDIKSWCAKTGNRLLDIKQEKNNFVVKIKKGGMVAVANGTNTENKNGKTMVVFSNDLDKAIASFIIANGAAAMGRKVTMFFTFWGLNILRKPDKVSVEKDFFGKMFGMMMPRGSKKLSLSKMNMGGAGSKMIRGIMKKKNIDSLEDLIKQAMNNGVEMVACNMSMDVMGIKKEELMDGVKIGGVATFLGAVEDSDMGLFI